MPTMYCAIVFHILTYWGEPPMRWSAKVETDQMAQRSVKVLNYSSTQGHDVITWAASLKECEIKPAKDHWGHLTYRVNFYGDGSVCHKYYRSDK